MGPASRNGSKASRIATDTLSNSRETKPVSETTDWKQKYRDSLLELETEERRWRNVERQLRRLIGRLCAAGMGVDSQLDDELTALAAANRRNAEASELEQLAESLTSAVAAGDAPSPVLKVLAPLPRKRWDSTCAAIAALLERLKSGATDGSTIQNLIASLATVDTDAALAAVVERAADIIHERGESLARERLQAAAVLSEVTKRLEEMAGYL